MRLIYIFCLNYTTKFIIFYNFNYRRCLTLIELKEMLTPRQRHNLDPNYILILIPHIIQHHFIILRAALKKSTNIQIYVYLNKNKT